MLAKTGGCGSAAALPRTLAHASASTSGPCLVAAPAARRGSGGGAARRLVCSRLRITNTKQEIYNDDDRLDPELSPYIEFEDFPVWDPDKGSLSTRINRTFLEEIRNDQISLEETAYWFNPPPGGWNPKVRLMKPVERDEPRFPEPYHDPQHAELHSTDLEGNLVPRLKLEELEEGDELAGVVTDVWLYHGAQVDVLAEWDGLVPVRQEEWDDVADDLLPGTQLVVRVHKLRQAGLYRWPLQLEVLEPAGLQGKIIAPDEWQSPADLDWAFGQGWTLEEVAQRLGRRYVSTKYMLERDHTEAAAEVQHAYGWDEEDVDGAVEDVVERELDVGTLLDIDDIARSAP